MIRGAARVLYLPAASAARQHLRTLPRRRGRSILEPDKKDETTMSKKNLKELFIEDLGQVTGGGKKPPITTLAIGEEDPATTLAIGEEDPYTTLALGEEEPLPTL